MKGVYIPWTLNGQSRCSLDPGWSERVFLETLENAEFICSLETMWYMAGVVRWMVWGPSENRCMSMLKIQSLALKLLVCLSLETQ